MAVGILVFGKAFSGLFENNMLVMAGAISYEIYLAHAFTLNQIKPAMISVFIFIVITCVLACILHVGMRKIKNGRFNSRNTYQK